MAEMIAALMALKPEGSKVHKKQQNQNNKKQKKQKNHKKQPKQQIANKLFTWPTDYEKLDKDIMRRCALYAGMNFIDRLTSKQLADRYTRIIAFMNIENANAPSALIGDILTELHQMVKQRFSNDEQQRITNKITQLSDPNRYAEIEKIREIIRAKSDEAIEFFACVVDEMSDIEEDMFMPPGWLQNQTEMRRRWELLNKTMTAHPEMYQGAKNKAFKEYMNYMYDAYMPGFGDELCKRVGEECDIPEIYYDLLKAASQEK